LKVASHFAGNTAQGQSTGSLVAICIASTGSGDAVFGVDGAGTIYAGQGCWGNLRPFTRIGQLPGGSAPTCMTSWSNGQNVFIGCANGDVYSFAPFASPPIAPGLCGNMTGGGPTPAKSTTWGNLKTHFR
jgi:hypothetical protein